jgi:predicted nucleic acid-binding protein
VNALVVDTSSWISYLAGRGPALVERALEEGRVHLPPIVAAELLSGKLGGRERGSLASLLDDLPMVRVDRAHWYRVGALRASLRAAGLTVSTPDAHVAQCVLDLRAELLTADAVFRLVARKTQLRLARPAAGS